MGIRLVGVPWVPVPLPEQPWRPASSRRPDSRGRTPEDYQLRDESPSPDARDRGARSDSGSAPAPFPTLHASYLATCLKLALAVAARQLGKTRVWRAASTRMLQLLFDVDS